MVIKFTDTRTEQRIRRLQKRTEAATPGEVIRRALQVYDMVTSTLGGGDALVVVQRGGVEREIMVV